MDDLLFTELVSAKVEVGLDDKYIPVDILDKLGFIENINSFTAKSVFFLFFQTEKCIKSF